jgi:hypothetical protein
MDISEQLLRTITSLQLPFRAVENQQFQRLVAMLNDEYKLPSHTTIRSRLLDRAAAIKKDLLNGLNKDSKVSLALDCWSSPTRLAFMAITAYFIDENWKYREALIGFEHLETVHTGVELAAVLKKVINSFGLGGRILNITTDNASNNNTMIRDMMADESFSNGQFADCGHLPCMAHVVQLALSELLGKIRIKPTNEELQRIWTDNNKSELQGKQGIVLALAKVCCPQSDDLSGDP